MFETPLRYRFVRQACQGTSHGFRERTEIRCCVHAKWMRKYARILWLGTAASARFSGRPHLNTPLLSSKRMLNENPVERKLFTVAKAQADKSCPLVAAPSSIVR